MATSMLGFPGPRPTAIEPGPAQMKIPKRPCRWRGWVDPEIIDRKSTEIMKRLKYFALFDVANSNDVASNSNRWQPFEMHTVKPMRESEVAKLLGHDFNTHGTNLKLTPFHKKEKFSDTTNATWLFGERPDFDTSAFFSNRGLGSGEEIEEENTGNEDEEEDTGDERDDSEASRLSTEREEIGDQFTGSEAKNMQVYNACNLLCFWTKTRPNARYA